MENQSTKTILVIEDADALRKDIAEMLSYEGYNVIEARDGLEGLQSARQYRPALVICDIMMPGLDGYEVFRELHNDSAFPVPPFIFLTAKHYGGMTEEPLPHNHLVKPFTVDELITAINKRLNPND